MRKFFLILAFICLDKYTNAKEQILEKPDYELIKKLTHDKTSAFYYPNLFKRYLDNDSSLKKDDYTMLYFGFFFQSAYKSINLVANYNDSLHTLLNQEHLSRGEWKKVINYIYKYFDNSPFDLNKLNLLFIAYHNINDEYYSMKYRVKLEMLIKTILATGDGKTSETGFHVLIQDDEYALLSVLGYEFVGKQTRAKDNNFDYLLLGKNQDGIDGMFFDTKQIDKKK